MKVAVFQVVDGGVDGRAPTKVIYSSVNESERDQFYTGLGKNKCYYRVTDTVLDLTVLGKSLIDKLDGNDKMLLDMCFMFDSTKDSLTTSYHDINVTCYTPKTK